MAKPLKRKSARKLRSQGESIRDISKTLKVSTSSVSRWCRDIELSDGQVKELEKRHRDPNYGLRLEYSQKQKRKRIEKEKRLRQEGIKDIGILSKRELFLIGIALYWAEGFKKDSRAGFGSSDPEMIKIFIRWLKKCCNYKEEDLTLRVTANESHKYRIEKIEKYWSKATGVPLTNFNKPFFQKVKWKKQYDNPEKYFGVLRIRVKKSKDFLRKIHGWIEGLQLNFSAF